MLNDTILKSKHNWVFKDPRIKAVADKAKQEGYRVWLNTEGTFKEGSFGLISPQDGSKLLYFQIETFGAFVSFTAELEPSHELGSGYALNLETMTTVEKIEKNLNIAELLHHIKPQVDKQGRTHNLLTLKAKLKDPFGLRGYAEY